MESIYKEAKIGIGTLILDSTDISPSQFDLYSKAIWENWLVDNKERNVLVIVRPHDNKVALWLGGEIKYLLPPDDVEQLKLKRSFTKLELYESLHNLEKEMISMLSQKIK